MKRNSSFFMTLTVISFLLYSCNTPVSIGKSNFEEAKMAITSSNDIYFEAFAKKDPSIFIERYAKDCCIMPPNRPAMCGENAAADFFKMAYYGAGIRNGKFITTQVYGDGEEFVTEEGLFQLFDANSVMIGNGKYLVLWKKAANGWKMFRDSFSCNTNYSEGPKK